MNGADVQQGALVSTALERAARDFGDRTAFRGGGPARTWREVDARVDALTAWLRRRGVGPGDRVAVLDWNSRPFFELTFAVARVGAVLMPVNVRLDGRQIAGVLERGSPKLVAARTDFAQVLADAFELGAQAPVVVWLGASSTTIEDLEGETWPEALAAEAAPGANESHGSGERDWSPDPAQLYFTSGTTGEPKGVVLTHANVGTHAEAAIAELGIDEDDVWIHVAPMFHLADAWATVAVTLAGGCHVFVPRFDAPRVAAAIDEHGVTLTNLIPTMLGALLEHVRRDGEGFDGSSLRVLLSGGAPIAPELVRRILETFRCEYVQTYGMTETSPYLTLSLLDDELRAQPAEVQLAYRAKTGRAFRGVDLRLVDDGGADVAADGASVGEIWARGPTVTPGYWNDVATTDAAFTDGWLRTGDLATVDERSFFDIVDRKKDVIITGGENVYSTEVEYVLYEHPAVLEAAVIGLPDERWGERVHAVVALAAGESVAVEQLLAHCRQRLPGFKSPKTLEVRDALPKTGSGKIHKRALRDTPAQA